MMMMMTMLAASVKDVMMMMVLMERDGWVVGVSTHLANANPIAD
jgi:hypothetical protein